MADQPKATAKNPLSSGVGDHYLGPELSASTIVVYSDFECPYSAQQHFALNDYAASHLGTRIVYKHFPKTEIHPDALLAAEASECASEAGKFWQYADYVYSNQDRLNQDFIYSLAPVLGLDPTAYKNCLAAEKYKDLVMSDYNEGRSRGVTNTPTTFFNGQMQVGSMPISVIEQYVQQY